MICSRHENEIMSCGKVSCVCSVVVVFVLVVVVSATTLLALTALQDGGHRVDVCLACENGGVQK